MELQEMFYEARSNNDPKVRQRFLSSIPLEDASEAIHSVTYIPENTSVMWKKFEPCDQFLPQDYFYQIKPLMLTKPRFPLVGQFSYSNVYVFGDAFNHGENLKLPSFSLGDLQSMLIDHEGFHARMFRHYPREAIPFWKPSENQRALFEVWAFERQLQRAPNRGCSSPFVAFIQNKLKEEMECTGTVYVPFQKL